MDDALVRAISAQLPDVTEEHCRMVLTTLDRVKEGAPVGTVLSDPQTGNIAVRVSESGVHMWRVTAPDGGVWADMQPTLPWPVLREGTPQ